PAHIDIDEMAMEAPTEPTKPAPAAANLEPKPAAFAPSPLEEQVILKSVQDWAAAWSSKDVNAYLGYYAEDFRLPSGGSRSAWAAQRRERISTPKSIRLGIESPQVTFTDGTHARVTFQQAYRSETVQKLARKTLLMVKTGGKWLIQEERVGG
ncbi:MAG TPA: nuclear transport factor 2 family protein, partial [Anaerolineae bacterium]|nr:nuclear transport factor 2 family protein [Anaerolineae bacterium]